MPALERAGSIFERLHDADAARIDYARDLSIYLERLGDVKLQVGQVAAAAPLFERAIALRQERMTRDPGNAEAVRDLAVGLERRADIAMADGQPAWALAALDRARELRSQVVGDIATADPVETRDLAVLWSRTGTARQALRRQDWPAAFDQAIALMAPLIEIDAAPPGWMRDLAVFRTAYGDALQRAARPGDARREWSEALALIERQLALNDGDPRLLDDRRTLRRKLGMRSAHLGAPRRKAPAPV
jgi:tetratricopeptide (TPR) repeat protein